MFTSQAQHRRAADTICAALPIESGEAKKRRFLLKQAADGLLAKGHPGLAGYEIERTRGVWYATFRRGKRAVQEHAVFDAEGEGDDRGPETGDMVDEIVAVTGDRHSRRYWASAVHSLGVEPVRFALRDLNAQMKMRSGEEKPIRNPGAWLTRKLQAMAEDRGIAIERVTRSKERVR